MLKHLGKSDWSLRLRERILSTHLSLFSSGNRQKCCFRLQTSHSPHTFSFSHTSFTCAPTTRWLEICFRRIRSISANCVLYSASRSCSTRLKVDSRRQEEEKESERGVKNARKFIIAKVYTTSALLCVWLVEVKICDCQCERVGIHQRFLHTPRQSRKFPAFHIRKYARYVITLLMWVICMRMLYRWEEEEKRNVRLVEYRKSKS